jgi:hypothetical protein
MKLTPSFLRYNQVLGMVDYELCSCRNDQVFTNILYFQEWKTNEWPHTCMAMQKKA